MATPTVTLISVDEYGPSLGIRFLSAVLKKAGFSTNVIFARGKVTRKTAYGEETLFTSDVHDDIAKIAESSLFVGLSVATPTFHKAREITENLKSRCDKPIIWGGVHAVIKPDECLNFADMLCVGEGENLVTELAKRLRDKKEYDDIPGIKFPGSQGLPPELPTIIDLPAPDYSFDGTHYFVTPGEKLIPFDVDVYPRVMFINYYLSPTRGCPHHCTYCINNKYSELYKGTKGKRFRNRDMDRLIDELKAARKKIPSIRRVIIDDDCFLALKTETVTYFAEQYQKHIGLPFVIRGAHPHSLTEDKLDILCDAGLIKLRVGVQTGSEHIRKLYARSWENNDKILTMAKMINKFIKQKRLRYVMYDFIVDNPWESQQDKQDTLDLILAMPKPFGLYNFSLTFYPGTELSERALAEQIAYDDPTSETYWKQYWDLAPTPINTALSIIVNMPLPSQFMRVVAKDNPVSKMMRFFLTGMVETLPEISLFFKTKMRYEVDILLMLGEKSREDAIKRLKQELYGNEPAPLRVMRQVLLEIYLRKVAPERMNIQ